ncbi:hypothetical protein J3Q64DRAFT_1138065 [Phycomyces blakesleeanus]|uniref:PWWP domain-containing protein n=1 Tax=Phycomyces blakesleeanus TaxID=4837 RepID=A0ABR3AX27_PHYBL
MTRRMAHQLTDEHGFKPNSFGYRYNRAVAVSLRAEKGKRNRMEYNGLLREMRGNQVRVWYPSLRQSDWLIIGSRRLRVLTDQEASELDNLGTELVRTMDTRAKDSEISTKLPTETKTPSPSTTETLPEPQSESVPKHVEETVEDTVEDTVEGEVEGIAEEPVEAPVPEPAPGPIKRGRGRPRKVALPVDPSNPHIVTIPKTPTKTALKKRNDSIKNGIKETKKAAAAAAMVVEMGTKDTEDALDYLTTGAFATRRAMRQLKDEHGFVPNPYGYVYDQPIEILNTRSSKNKFWERGRLIGMCPGKVLVRYDGWGEVYDEWVMVGSRRIRPAAAQIESSGDQKSSTMASTENTAPTSTLNGGSASTKKRAKQAARNDLLVTEANPEVEDEARKKRQHRVLGPEDYERLGLLAGSEKVEKIERRGRKKMVRDVETPKETETMKDKAVLIEEEPKPIEPSVEAPIVQNEDQEMAEPESDLTKPNGAMTVPEGTQNDLPVKRKKQKAKTQQRKRKPAKATSPSPSVSSSTSLQQTQAQTELSTELSTETETETPTPISTSIVSVAATEADHDTSTLTSSYRRHIPSDESNHGFVANVYGYDYLQHVQVLHLDKKWYEGRLVSMERNRVRVHYCGWLDKFDENIAVGSRRIQVIENDHEVVCIEPTYSERLEKMQEEKEKKAVEPEDAQVVKPSKRREVAPTVVPAPEEPVHGTHDMVEYHMEAVDGMEVEENDTWKVYCNQCNIIIKQFRYYCTYCETPSEGHDYQSFELCLR